METTLSSVHGSTSYSYCKLHPVVLFSVLDHYIRKSEGYRVIGTLTGFINDGVVEIKNCFPVPHTELDQVGVDMEFHHVLLDLHHKVSPKEVIVGWYSTSSEINDASVLIHQFYSREMNQPPIHLTVDTALTDGSMGIKAYTSLNIAFGEKSLGSQFLPVPLEIVTFDVEKIGVNVLVQAMKRQQEVQQEKKQASSQVLMTDLDSLELSIQSLLEMIETVHQYVNKVLDGSVVGDTKIGRLIADSVMSLPRVDMSTMEKMFNANLQDLLLVVYLANLTRTQLQLAEKLQKVL